MEALSQAGHQQVLLSPGKGLLSKSTRKLDVTVHDATLRNVWSLSRQVDIVHVHDAHAHTLAALGCRKSFVVSRRVAFPVHRSGASRWKYSRAKRFLAVSRFVAEQLYAAGIPADRVDIVYDAVGESAWTGEWSVTAPVVALANQDPMKGRDLVQLAESASGLKVLYSSDLARDLKWASMFLYITKSEGLGSAALLAMSMGVPVIASRVGGLGEIFEDGISGIYVENDAGQIASAMRSLVGDRELALSIISEAHAQIAARFTTRHLLESTLQSYSRALAG